MVSQLIVSPSISCVPETSKASTDMVHLEVTKRLEPERTPLRP